MNDKLIQIGGKSYKKSYVIMLPTEKASKLYLHKTAGLNLLSACEHKIGSFNGSNQYLYILSNENIKEGDWFLDRLDQLFQCDKDILRVSKEIRDKYYKKIIATTDELPIDIKCDNNGIIPTYLPRPSDDFIRAFVKAQGKGFDKVLVEYEDDCTKGLPLKDISYSLKVSPDNTITIKPIQEKTSWSREELHNIISKHEYDKGIIDYKKLIPELFNLIDYELTEIWIKENL